MSEPFPNREWESGACHVDGLKLAYRRRAGAGYPLIALHGLMGSGACLLPLARYLPADLDIILPDARGHGGSDAPSSGYGYGEMASDVVGIVEKLSLHSPVLLGHSMGGMTAALATSERGLAIAALVLVDPTFLDPERQREVHDSDVAGEHRRSITAPRQTLLDQARSRNPRRSEELIEHLVDARFGTSLEVFAVLEPPNPDFRDIVTALKVPTLLVIGDRGILSVDTAKELHERNPLLSYATLGDVGHGMPYDEPQRLGSLVTAWLAGGSTEHGRRTIRPMRHRSNDLADHRSMICSQCFAVREQHSHQETTEVK